MNATLDAPWTSKSTDTIDQRELALPPTWMTRARPAAERSELGQDIHESGRTRGVADAVVALLDGAGSKCIVSSFLLSDTAIEDAMLRAAGRGVRVYVLLASEARLGNEQGDGEFDKLVLKTHIDMLTRLGGHVLMRSASHFHAKVVVTDPDSRPAGILLTANLTTDALQRNDELAVRLHESEVRELTALLKWAMWESAEHELLDPRDRFKAVQPLGSVPHPEAMTGVVATTAQANSLRAEALRLVNAATTRIVVSSFGWDHDHEVVQRLCQRARDGLALTVLARLRPASMPALLALAEAGATVLAFKWLHAKAIWTDQGEALVMSANVQFDGLDRGFELGVRLAGERAHELRQRLETWSEAAPWHLLPRPRLGALVGAAKLWRDGQLVDIDIAPSKAIDLGAVTAASADVLQAPMPRLPMSGTLAHTAHELHCSWSVMAPTLAPKARQVHRPASADQPAAPYAPPLYREPDGRMVVAVTSPSELPQARSVMAETGASAIVLAQGSQR